MKEKQTFSDLINQNKSYHGKLIGIYNETPSWREFTKIVIFLGLPFAIIIAGLWVLIKF